MSNESRFESQAGLPLWCVHCRHTWAEHVTRKRLCPAPVDNVRADGNAAPSAQLPRSLNLSFPMRPDFMAKVLIPRDLTTAEAKRLAAFVQTLASSMERAEQSDAPESEATP